MNPELPRRRVLYVVLAGVLVAVLVTLAAVWGKPSWRLVSNPERLQQLIAGWGIWAPLGLVGIQLLQIVFAPLPGNVVAIAAGYAFGLGKGLLWCMVGVVLGAAVAFLLSRVAGRNLIQAFVRPATLEKFDAFVVRRGPFYVFLLLLFPNPIGDWVYYLAGLTAIPLPVFLLIVLVGRIPSNLAETFIGAQIARFGSQGYRFATWQVVLFFAGLIALALAYYLNRRRIENFFLRFTKFPTD